MIECIITSSILIIILSILRVLFNKKISYRLQYALWGIILLRLIMPFQLIDSPISIMNWATFIGKQDVTYTASNLPEVSDRILSTEKTDISQTSQTMVYSELEQKLVDDKKFSNTHITNMIVIIWVMGSVFMGLWLLSTNYIFYRRLKNNRKAYNANDCKIPVYVTEQIASPCLFGFIHPSIYLTAKAAQDKKNLSHVLLHELCHYYHGDHIWSIFRGLCLVIYWWNPFIWVAVFLSHIDSELACDESVINRIGDENRLAYGYALVDMIAVRKSSSDIMCAATMMFSEKQYIKKRLFMIINKPKTNIPAFLLLIVIIIFSVGCTFTSAQNQLPLVNNTTTILSVDIDRTDLDACVSEAILSRNTDKYLKGDFASEAHTVLKTSYENNKVTVYASVLYLEFNFTDSSFSEISGGHSTAAITFIKNTADEYILIEYWEPQEGVEYNSSLQEKLPIDVYNQVNNSKYIFNEMQTCYGKAIEHSQVDAAVYLAQLFEVICSSPTASSVPSDYIHAHQAEYQEILYYGNYALQYIYSEFLKGGQTDLRGHIMLIAMRELLRDEDMDFTFSTAQEWFDKWEENTIQLKKENSMEFIEKNYPKTAIMLKMLQNDY